MNNCEGYSVDQDPAPMLIVLPIEDAAKEYSKERFRPMLLLSPQLKQHIKGKADKKDKLGTIYVGLKSCNVYFGYAGSPITLASRAIRYVFNSEVDKFPSWSGREAAPGDLAEERTRTFWNRKIWEDSTPTVRGGNIWRAWEKSLQHRYYVPCPHCGVYQVLLWPQVKYPADNHDADAIKNQRLAWYECSHCKQKITDLHKPRMNAKGVWLAEGHQQIDTDGNITGEKPKSRHWGFHINCLYSPWLTFSEVAAKFISSKDDVEKLQNFINSWLGEPWEERVQSTSPDVLVEHMHNYAPGVVPDEAFVLTAGVDVQAHQLYYVIRAWGAHETSWLIREGFCEDFVTMEEIVGNTQYPCESHGRDPMGVTLAAIDTGHRTAEVYDFCRLRPWTMAVKGRGARQITAPFSAGFIDKFPGTNRPIAGGLTLYSLNVDIYKGKIHHLLKHGYGEPGYWHLHRETSTEYRKQFAAEHQVQRRMPNGGIKYEWRLVTNGAANHFLDCEVYSVAAADKLGIKFRKGPVRMARPQEEKAKPEPKQNAWVGDRGNNWGKRH